jgi:hypothetical protein
MGSILDSGGSDSPDQEAVNKLSSVWLLPSALGHVPIPDRINIVRHRAVQLFKPEFLLNHPETILNRQLVTDGELDSIPRI